LRENEQADLFKDSAMLKRFQDIVTLPEKEKECLLTTVDHFIKASKIYLQKYCPCKCRKPLQVQRLIQFITIPKKYQIKFHTIDSLLQNARTKKAFSHK